MFKLYKEDFALNNYNGWYTIKPNPTKNHIVTMTWLELSSLDLGIMVIGTNIPFICFHFWNSETVTIIIWHIFKNNNSWSSDLCRMIFISHCFVSRTYFGFCSYHLFASYQNQYTSVNQKFCNILLILFTNPSARARYDTRSIFKRSLTDLNSEFSFS